VTGRPVSADIDPSPPAHLPPSSTFAPGMPTVGRLGLGERSIVISRFACVSVREHISGTARSIFAKYSVHVTHGRGSALLLSWRCDMSRPSGFTDDVIANKLSPCGGGKTVCPSSMAVRLSVDLRPSADGSAVRTSLVAGHLRAASVPIA